VRRTPLVLSDSTHEKALAHAQVNDVVMIDSAFTPVLMSSGTVFKNEKDTVEFLKHTDDALRDVL